MSAPTPVDDVASAEDVDIPESEASDAAEAARVTRRRLQRGIVLAAIATAILYALFVLSTDARSVGRAIAQFPPWVLLAAMALSFGNYLVRFVRWQMYCRRLGIVLDARTSFTIHLAGLAFTVSPGKMGEAFKSLLVKRVAGTPVHVSAPIVLAERFTDLLAFLLLIVIGTSSLPADHAWIVWCTLALCAGLFLFVTWQRAQVLVLGLISRTRVGARIAPRIEGALSSSRTLLHWRALLVPTLIAAVGWSLECAGFCLVASAFAPAGVGFLFAMSTYALAAVAGAVAFIFPGGLGVTEASMGALLRRRYVALGLGLDAATAGAVSATILIRFATLWFAVGVGLVALFVFRRRHGALA
jgi:uncharacterized protein (TIRG00374 family)